MSDRLRRVRSRSGTTAANAALAGLAALLSVMAAAPAARAADPVSLEITITGIESATGTIRLAVYDGPDGFREPDRAVAHAAAPAAPGSLVLTVDDLIPGPHAVVVFHDEDDDGTLDRFLGMIPTEGYGVSNNPTLSGPPAFAESAFSIGDTGARISIDMRY